MVFAGGGVRSGEVVQRMHSVNEQPVNEPEAVDQMVDARAQSGVVVAGRLRLQRLSVGVLQHFQFDGRPFGRRVHQHSERRQQHTMINATATAAAAAPAVARQRCRTGCPLHNGRFGLCNATDRGDGIAGSLAADRHNASGESVA
jgi:hypothetical protein